jgi:hypothetical protein
MLYNKESVMTCLRFTILICALIGAAVHAEEKSDGIGYATVNDALTSLKSKDRTEISIQGGWTIVQDNVLGNMVLWSFAPETHEAHPAAVKRTVLEKDDTVFIRMEALCQASKLVCDSLMEEFKKLNDRIRESM